MSKKDAAKKKKKKKTKARKPLVPRLRFPEFKDAGEWDKSTLKKACLTITNGKTNAQDHEEDGEYPLFDRSETIKRSSSYMFDAEAIIIPGEGMRFQPRYYHGKFNLHQRAYALMDCQADARFVYYYMDRAKNLLAQKAVKSTVLSLRLPIIEKFVFVAPKKDEQQRIADCLTSLDELIAACGRKLGALKAHKKGLMQNLFPRPGETTPRLRFPEFKDAGEWKTAPLRAVLDYERPDKYIVTNTSYQNHGTPVLTANQSFILGYTGETHGVYTATPAIIFDDFTVDRKYVDFPFKVRSSAIKILKHKEKNNLKFLFESMGRISFDPTQHKRYYISEYQNRTIPLPGPAEQQKIADCLTSLDELIAACGRKLDALKAHKKGLMQQLFPSLEGDAG